MIEVFKKFGNAVLLFNGEYFGQEDLCKVFAGRVFDLGLGERNSISVAVGFLVRGKLPVLFISDTAAVRAFAMIREAICQPNLNVKIVAVGGEDMADVEMMRALPNMQIMDAADSEKMMEKYGPVYLRLKV